MLVCIAVSRVLRLLGTLCLTLIVTMRDSLRICRSCHGALKQLRGLSSGVTLALSTSYFVRAKRAGDNPEVAGAIEQLLKRKYRVPWSLSRMKRC